MWRSLADRVTGLGGMTVQLHYLSRYANYPPPQPLAQLSFMLTELGVTSVKLNYPVGTIVHLYQSFLVQAERENQLVLAETYR